MFDANLMYAIQNAQLSRELSRDLCNVSSCNPLHGDFYLEVHVHLRKPKSPPVTWAWI